MNNNHWEMGDFQTILPKNKHNQEDIINWMAEFQSRQEVESLRNLVKKRFQRYMISPQRIQTRYFEGDDIGKKDFDNHKINGNNPQLSDRSEFYQNRVNEIFRKFYPHNEAPSHIVHASCTGYTSPSAPQFLASEKKWEKMGITHSYHMGCYGAFPAIRTAKSLVSNHLLQKNEDPFSVDIVHTELCILHMRSKILTPEQIIIHSLFADGNIKYSVTPAGSLTHGLKIGTLREQVIPQSTGSMSWIPRNWGFEMTLGREVPSLIAQNLKKFLKELAQSERTNFEDLQKEALFAIHPGGPRIIDQIQDLLHLSEEQVQESKNILLSRGNMSSATVPHIFQSMVDKQYKSGQKIVAMAFGPGLTMFGGIFQFI